MSDELPGSGNQSTGRDRRLQEIAECVVGAKSEHRALAVAGDRGEFVHDIVHALAARGREEHPEIVDAEIFVDDARCDYLAIREDFRDDDRLDALGAFVRFEREVAAIHRK